MPFSESLRSDLLKTAWQSIRHGLEKGNPLQVDPGQQETSLSRPGASFVTLHIGDELRGCIGSLQAQRPLICDVAENAFSAAFRDPRFAPLTEAELETLSLDISVLSEAERMVFDSEQDLLKQIRPDVDGLILKDGNYRGTFLPSVWKSLPDAKQFLQHLKLKAGLPADHWSDTLEVWRYTTESFGDQDN
jgi:AmmeMemoRadiSam system protein A